MDADTLTTREMVAAQLSALAFSWSDALGAWVMRGELGFQGPRIGERPIPRHIHSESLSTLLTSAIAAAEGRL